MGNLPVFHALSFAGQMVVGTTPVTFCFVVNWMREHPDSEALTPAFIAVVKGSMEAVKQGLPPGSSRDRIVGDFDSESRTATRLQLP